MVLPRKSGTRTVLPAGFKIGTRYPIVGSFTPNGSSDLHFYVVGEAGMIYPLRYDAVKIVAIRAIGQCIVLPRKSGSREVMPAGFVVGRVYEAVLPFTPNGSSDLHFYVIGEGGMIYPLIGTGIKVLTERSVLPIGNATPAPVPLSVGENYIDSIAEGTLHKTVYDIILRKDGVMESYKLTLIMRAANQFSYLISDYLNHPDSGGTFDVSASVVYNAPNFTLVLTALSTGWVAYVTRFDTVI
jgi:hypothetical protein